MGQFYPKKKESTSPATSNAKQRLNGTAGESKNQQDVSERFPCNEPEKKLSPVASALEDVQNRLTNVADKLKKQSLLFPAFRKEDANLNNSALEQRHHPIVDLAESLKDSLRETRVLIQNLSCSGCFCLDYDIDGDVEDDLSEFSQRQKNLRKGPEILVTSRTTEERQKDIIVLNETEVTTKKGCSGVEQQVGKSDFIGIELDAKIRTVKKEITDASPKIPNFEALEVSRKRSVDNSKVKRWLFGSCETIPEEDEDEVSLESDDEYSFPSEASDLIFVSSNRPEADDFQLADLEDDPDYHEVVMKQYC